jgi:tryptophan-rich sensory protein
MQSLVFAGAVCVVAMAGEAVLAGKCANATMRSLNRPSWALSTWAWYLIGLAYYAACFLTLYRVSRSDPANAMRSLSLALVIGVMTANVSWNFLFFRRRNFGISFWFFVPYALLVIALVSTLTQVDMLSAFAFCIYVLYLPYALIWTFRIWKLNA